MRNLFLMLPVLFAAATAKAEYRCEYVTTSSGTTEYMCYYSPDNNTDRCVTIVNPQTGALEMVCR